MLAGRTKRRSIAIRVQGRRLPSVAQTLSPTGTPPKQSPPNRVGREPAADMRCPLTHTQNVDAPRSIDFEDNDEASKGAESVSEVIYSEDFDEGTGASTSLTQREPIRSVASSFSHGPGRASPQVLCACGCQSRSLLVATPAGGRAKACAVRIASGLNTDTGGGRRPTPTPLRPIQRSTRRRLSPSPRPLLCSCAMQRLVSTGRRPRRRK